MRKRPRHEAAAGGADKRITVTPPRRLGDELSERRPSGPDVRYPPPLLFVLSFAVGSLLHHAWPLPLVAPAARGTTGIVGWFLVAVGTTLALSGVLTFRRVGTALRPDRPAARLVTHGPFRISRNPMYLGLSVVYAGVILLMNSWWLVLFLPLVLALLHVTVIRREETYLAATFGSQYRDYCRRVRRWL
jgi:protein-S-isoprenylcysteine O-methyltransferase Ste14